ncbi:MAG: hypothetical protein WDN72_04465 [Alphaproteobacteria bacterium]
MLGWVIRAILFLSGVLTGLVVAQNTDSDRFAIMQMAIGLLLIVLFLFLASLWPRLVAWMKRGKTP